MLFRLARIASLRPADIRLLASAAAAVAAARIGLSMWSFETVHRYAAAGAPGAASGTAPDRIAWAVAAVSRRIPGTTCLPQAVAALALLRGAGIAAELHVGVARDDDRRAIAHAWIEHEGRVLIGDTDEDYAPFPLHPDGGPR